MPDLGGGVPDEQYSRAQKCNSWSHNVWQDPMLLWERFPCPPPDTDKARMLLELDWTGQLGTKDGCRALKIVASRCNVDLTAVSLPPPVIPDCDELNDAFRTCGTNCVIAIVLACICILFFLLLIIVCVRYVRRNEAESSPVKSTLTIDQSGHTTQVNRYYIRHQYMCGSAIPERHALPYEARIVDNGVEARLLKAIQNQNISHQQYSPDDTCSQCRLQQNTLNRRQGYERIYWKDKDYLQTRVPSIESLNRKPLERHRSTAGSTSDMSHFYESISDNNPAELSYNSSVGRRSNNSSLRYYPRTYSANLKEMQNYGDQRVSDDERGLMMPRNNDRPDYDVRDCVGRNDLRNVGGGFHPVRSMDKYNISPSGGMDPFSDRQPSQQSLQQASAIGGHSAGVFDSRVLENRPTFTLDDDIDETLPKNSEPDSKTIKGYQYTFNPYFGEEANRVMMAAGEEAPSPKLPFEDNDPDDASDTPPSKSVRSKRKRRRPSSCSYNSNNSESTSVSDTSANRHNGTAPRTNGSFYNRTSCGNK